jgi:hypothetical protein
MVVGEFINRLRNSGAHIESIESKSFACVASAKVTLLEGERDYLTNCCNVGLCNDFVVVCSPRRVNSSEYGVDLAFGMSSLQPFIITLEEVLAGKWVEAPNSSTTVNLGSDTITMGTCLCDLDIGLTIVNSRKMFIDKTLYDDFTFRTSLESGKQLLKAFKQTYDSVNSCQALAS